MRSQERPLGALNVKGVLAVAGWMVGRRVESIEAMVFVFDFGTVCHHKSYFSEALDDVFGDLG